MRGRDRSTALLLIAVALAGYGVYVVRYVPGLLVGPPVPLLLIGFALQAVCAFAAAVGVWRRQGWAAGATVLLGLCIAATWLAEAFVFGIVAALQALVVAVFAIVVSAIIAAYVRRADGGGEAFGVAWR